MKKKILLYLNIVTLLLLITVSFAWINEIDTKLTKFFELNYSQLYISPTKVKVELFRYDDNDDVEITDASGVFYNSTNVEPGDYTLYTLKITNESNAAMNVGINFTDITGTELMYEYINIGISYVNGFSNEFPAPPIDDFYVKDRLMEGTVPLVDSMLLPPYETGDKNMVEIKFYIKLSHEATIDVQDATFALGTINVITT